jgi:type II secretory pathway predicted ATPase ExeA
MEKFFNTSGPVKQDKHYTLDPLTRLDWQEIHHLIDNERYFVLHAPRQTGKTSALLAMMKTLNEEGNYAAVYANIEGAQAARGDTVKGIDAICGAIASSIRLYLNDEGVFSWLSEVGREQATQDKLRQLLAYWAQHSTKPTILFLDEVDALVGDTLISLLRQIRAGYAQRPEAFPQSIVLCGVRDVRDNRLHQADGYVITGGSAFNIKAKSLRMGNFTQTEMKTLLLQHTVETGQVFDETIFEQMWLDTQGQPWLVNAVAYEMTWENKPARDRSKPISLEQYRQARETLIYSRATHLDQLTDKLREPRVHRVISALLATDQDMSVLNDITSDDQQYVEDLGLITVSRTEGVAISNRIYQEVIPRELTWLTQSRLSEQQSWYLTPERRIDMPKLLSAFQQFFRENVESWIERFQYKEAGPQLLMQAFLQRIINGGGRINREYALGSQRTDLFIEWPIDAEKGFYGEVQRIVIELKIQHAALDRVIADGIIQTKGYADKVGTNEMYLVIFNRNPNVLWEDKIWQKTVDNVLVVGW